ncbi:MAG: conjugal transfer protein [Clostridiales bacterium]
MTSKKKKTKLKKDKKMVPKTSQDTLPFEYFYTNGVMFLGGTKYAMCAKFDNIDYIMARQEDKESIFTNYCTVLNSLDNNVKMQLFLNNVNINENDLSRVVKINRNDNRYTNLLDEYNSILDKKIKECQRNTSKKELFIILSTESMKMKSAVDSLFSVYNEIKTNFRKIGSKVELLAVNDYCEQLYYFFNSKRRVKKDFYMPNDMFYKGMNIKDIIAPSAFNFRANYFEMGETYNKVLYVRDLPTSMRDDFISNLLDCPYTISLSLHIESIETGDAIKSIKRRITSMESNKIQYKKKGGMTLSPYIPYDLQTSLAEAKDLLDSIVLNNKKLFYVSIYIMIIADNLDELMDRTNEIQSICRKHIVKAEVLSHQQEDGMVSVAPIGNDEIKIKRTLLSDSTAIFIPYSMQDLIQENGFYYGVNQISRSMMILSRSNMENPAGFILGRPRSGKSFSCKREIVNVILSTGDDILVIDPEDEYSNLCRNFGGEVIKISADSDNHINPLEMTEDYGAGENPIRMKAEFVLSVFECLLGELKPIEKTLIDRAVTQIYQIFFNNESSMPTMKTLHDFLVKQEEEEAKSLALSIELYVSGSLNMFSNRTNIDMNNRFTVFNTKDLGKQLKTLGMLVVLDFIWNRVCYNWTKKKRTWIYIDEFYMLFSSEYISAFFNEFFKRSQKRGGIPTGITQNVQEILNSDMARYMLSNSEFMMMFNQSPSDREELSKLLKISPTQMSYITDSEEGSGLMLMKGNVIPYSDKFPKDTQLYKMITTKVTDLF